MWYVLSRRVSWVVATSTMFWLVVPGCAVRALAADPAASLTSSELLFREDWKETPAALPVTQEHVATRGLTLFLHGPGQRGIKKSHHDDKPGDPWYIWSGQCLMKWGLSLKPSRYLMDLSAADARLRLRTRQQGDRALHVLVKLPDEWWYISRQSIPASEDWTDFEFKLSELDWKRFNVITVAAEEKTASVSLAKVEEIGFTDLKPGAGSKACSRVDWIEVHGRRVSRPPTEPPLVRSSAVAREIPPTVREHAGLTYARYGQRELSLDLYEPIQGDGPFPAVAFIHGGGWYKGDRSSYTPMAQQLAARGFVTATIEYRLSGEAPFPAALHDCKTAIRWMRANAERFRVDPDRIGCVGGSAGGHLSGLLATSGNVSRLDGNGGHSDRSSAVQAAVVMAGSMDLTSASARESANADPRKRMITFMGGVWKTAKDNYVDASPISHVSQSSPPFLFLDGEFDKPGERYPEFRRRLDEVGVDSEFHMMANAPHAFWSRHPFFEPALEHVSTFFVRTLVKRTKVVTIDANHQGEIVLLAPAGRRR